MARTNIVFIIVVKLITLLSEDAPSRQQLVELSSRTSYSVLGRPCYIYKPTVGPLCHAVTGRALRRAVYTGWPPGK